MLKRGTNNTTKNKKKESLFNKIVAWIHLWPSLISAVVLIIVCLTGVIVTYTDEILLMSAGEAKYVKDIGASKLSPQQILAKYKEVYPEDRKPGYIVSYKDPKRSTRINVFSPKKGLQLVYMDPYNGKILKIDRTIFFFYTVSHLHAALLMGKTGGWIVGIATIIFLIELITGLILWFPPNWKKHNRDASFKIKWKAKFKRLNYDLHNVIGFYALIISIILTVTGLLIAFRPLQELTLKMFGTSSKAHEWEENIENIKIGADHWKNYADIEKDIFNRYPERNDIQIATFDLSDSSSYYIMRVAKSIGAKSAEKVTKLYVDRLTGKEIPVPKFVTTHNKIEDVYWNLHLGKWMGQTGKFVTFVGGLVATSLPITGFLIWWGRRKKKKKTAPLQYK